MHSRMLKVRTIFEDLVGIYSDIESEPFIIPLAVITRTMNRTSLDVCEVTVAREIEISTCYMQIL